MACFAESLLHNELNPIIDWFIHVYTTYFRYKWWYLFLGLPHYSHWWQWLLNYPSKFYLWANSPTAPKNRTAPNIRLQQVAVLTHRLQPDFAAHASKFCTPKKSSWIIILPIHESMAFHGNIPMLTLNISQGLTKELTHEVYSPTWIPMDIPIRYQPMAQQLVVFSALKRPMPGR